MTNKFVVKFGVVVGGGSPLTITLVTIPKDLFIPSNQPKNPLLRAIPREQRGVPSTSYVVRTT
jgi:hypothetical protein